VWSRNEGGGKGKGEEKGLQVRRSFSFPEPEGKRAKQLGGVGNPAPLKKKELEKEPRALLQGEGAHSFWEN